MSLAMLSIAALLPLMILPNAALYLALRRTRRRLPLCDEDREDALPSVVYASAFLFECVASAAAAVLAVFGRLLPSRHGDPAAEVRIVLVHGLGQSHGNLALLARRLAGLGFGVVSFPYPSLGGDVAAAAEGLRRLIGELQEQRPGPVHLVGFGVGGLVARTCVRRHRVPGVRRLITIGTPHLGTLLAPRWPPALAALRPDSDFLRQLAAADRAPEQFEATALQSEFDATILPPDNAYYPAAFNIIVRDTGHFTLLFSPRIVALVAENLADSGGP